MGLDNVKIIPSNDNNVMDIGKLEVALNKTIQDGARIGTIFATMGTTDAFESYPMSPFTDKKHMDALLLKDLYAAKAFINSKGWLTSSRQ